MKNYIKKDVSTVHTVVQCESENYVSIELSSYRKSWDKESGG